MSTDVKAPEYNEAELAELITTHRDTARQNRAWVIRNPVSPKEQIINVLTVAEQEDAKAQEYEAQLRARLKHDRDRLAGQAEIVRRITEGVTEVRVEGATLMLAFSAYHYQRDAHNAFVEQWSVPAKIDVPRRTAEPGA